MPTGRRGGARRKRETWSGVRELSLCSLDRGLRFTATFGFRRGIQLDAEFNSAQHAVALPLAELPVPKDVISNSVAQSPYLEALMAKKSTRTSSEQFDLERFQRELNEAHERIDTLERILDRLSRLTVAKIAGPEVGDVAARRRGYRWTCQAVGHGSPRTQHGDCRETYREARDDLQVHADAFHDGSTAGAAIGGCDL